MIPGVTSRRRFSDLSEQEILALAISSEEDDARIYRSYAEMLREDFPDSARVFDGMAEEEDTQVSQPDPDPFPTADQSRPEAEDIPGQQLGENVATVDCDGVLPTQ